MTYQFSWTVLWSGQTGAWLLQGILVTLQISALGWLAAVALGIISGAFRTVPIAVLRWLAACYVEFFRNVPLLVWMFFWYFGMPPLLPEAMREWLLDHGAEFWAAVCALGVYHGARFSEVIRAGILSIPKTHGTPATSFCPKNNSRGLKAARRKLFRASKATNGNGSKRAKATARRFPASTSAAP